MENRIVTRSLRRQLDLVIVHEQMENDTAIKSNLSAYQIDQQFVTLRRVSQSKKRHSWMEERPIGHIMPQATSIIPREVQTSEAQKHTISLQ